MQTPQMPQVLKHVDNYIVFNEKLGGGQFSQVYKAMDKNDKTHTKHFAVKVIPMSSAQYNKFANYNQLLQKEIEILLKARHENLICMHDLKQTPNNLYLFLDYCNGGDLRHYITKKKNRLAEEEALELFKQLCAGYQALNEKKIIHRDLKPENILLHDSKIKIGDFGFARIVSDLDQAVRMTQKCSPLYAPPQILQNEKYSSKCDVWSMGCIFFEMLYGRPPFNAHSIVSLLENIKKLVGSTPYVLPTYPPIAQEAKDILQRMLMFHEKDRISWDEIFKHSILSKNAVKKLVEIEPSNATNPLYQSIRKNVDAVWENTLNQQQVLIEINSNSNNIKKNAPLFSSPSPVSLVTPVLSPKIKQHQEGSKTTPNLNILKEKKEDNNNQHNTLKRIQSMQTEDNKKENEKNFENRPERAFSTAWQTAKNINDNALNNHNQSTKTEQFYSTRPSDGSSIGSTATRVESVGLGGKSPIFRDRSLSQKLPTNQNGINKTETEQLQQPSNLPTTTWRQADQATITHDQFQTHQTVNIVSAPRSPSPSRPSWFTQPSPAERSKPLFPTTEQFSPAHRQMSPQKDKIFSVPSQEGSNKERIPQINARSPQNRNIKTASEKTNYTPTVSQQQQAPLGTVQSTNYQLPSSSNLTQVKSQNTAQAQVNPSVSPKNTQVSDKNAPNITTSANCYQQQVSLNEATNSPPSTISAIESDKELSENQKYVLYMKQIKLNESEKAFIKKIDNFFKFLRRRALFANAALLNFWNSTRQFKLDPSTQCSILYCLCSYYYVALEQLRSVLFLESEQKLIKKDGFDVYQRSQEYQITKEIINADVIEAKQLFADIQPFLLSEIHRANQMNAPEAVQFSKFIESSQAKKHDEYRVKLQPLLIRAMNSIDIDTLDKIAAKGVYMTQIFTNLEQFVPSKLYNDFDFNKFYDDHFNNPTLSQLKADVSAFSANYFSKKLSVN